MDRSSLRESAGFWAAIGGALVTLAALPVTIGIVEANAASPGRVELFGNGWFVAGFILACCGLLSVVWSLVLFIAHHEREVHPIGLPSAVGREPATGSPAENWVDPKRLAEYLDVINKTMEEKGFGRNPSLRPVVQPPSEVSRAEPEPVPQAASDSATLTESTAVRITESPSPLQDVGHMGQPRLPMGDRQGLRAIIRQGERLEGLSPTVGSVDEWTKRASQWLFEHGQNRTARKLLSGEPTSDAEAAELLKARLVDLRVSVVSSIPPGFHEDLTPLEALERFMEVQAIPEEDRAELRTLAEKGIREVSSQPSDEEIARDLGVPINQLDEEARELWWETHGATGTHLRPREES